MKGMAICGVDPKTNLVDIVATVNDDNLKEIMDIGCLPVITTMTIAREVWGRTLETPFDLVAS